MLDVPTEDPGVHGHSQMERHVESPIIEIFEQLDPVPDWNEGVLLSSSCSDETEVEEISNELANLDLGQDDTPNEEPTVDNAPAEPSSPAASSSILLSAENQIDPNKPGASIAPCVPALEQLRQKKIALGEAPAAPFADFLEFEFVKWMVERDISQGSREKLLKLPIIVEHAKLSFRSNYKLNQLFDALPTAGPKWRPHIVKITGDIIGPDGERLTEETEMWSRNILELIQELLENITYGEDMVFATQFEYNDAAKTNRSYSEMWTGDWWQKIQDKLPLGATILPVILSSDATHLTNLGGGKKAWPVYITLGNIPKSIRRKPTSYATLLLGYLPKEKLFHACMKELVRPLEEAGKTGVDMTCGDGYIRRCYPILPAYVADNPEQTMIACCAKNRCYRCTCPRDQRGDHEVHPDWQPSETSHAVEAQALGHTSSLYDTQGLRPFGRPFWADLPYCNISTALTPDILHQLPKGAFREHLMNWCLALVEKANVDSRYNSGKTHSVMKVGFFPEKAMPPHSNLRHFRAGITKLEKTTGKEHKDMEKTFVGVMAGLVNKEVMDAVVAIIDFIYYAQLPSHSDITLKWMDDALTQFHDTKDIFIQLGVRDNFNINKIHLMIHYTMAIRELGTMDGYNTESPERLHIEFAKCAYEATNRIDLFRQMTMYLERRERVFKFDAFLHWAIPEYKDDRHHEKDLMSVNSAPGWKIAKKSPFGPVSQDRLARLFGIHYFDYALDEFLSKYYPNSTVKVDRHDRLTVFPKATQRIHDVVTSDLTDLIHASPHASGSCLSPFLRTSKFDTVLIRKETAMPDQPLYGMKDHRGGQVRLIFTLPPKYGTPDPLVYIHRFERPRSQTPIQLTGMFRVQRERYPAQYHNHYIGEILPLSSIRRSCHLCHNLF
ncbi:hypothetical protein BDV93DRAFT_559654 [Ceratobasidium sp. AG-I]|nr:hypothetical protein BDV93DRAFT_559654 [Ceratobasidium sp. AG-I]